MNDQNPSPTLFTPHWWKQVENHPNRKSPIVDRCHSLTYNYHNGQWIVKGRMNKYGIGFDDDIYLDCLQSETEVNAIYPEAVRKE